MTNTDWIYTWTAEYLWHPLKCASITHLVTICNMRRLLEKKNPASWYSGGTQTHNLLLSSADIIRPPNLPVATGWFEVGERGQWCIYPPSCVSNLDIHGTTLPILVYMALALRGQCTNFRVDWFLVLPSDNVFLRQSKIFLESVTLKQGSTRNIATPIW